MFLFDRLFGSKKKAAPAAEIPSPAPAATAAETTRKAAGPSAPGTQIRYDPDLIGNLKEDHQSMLEIFTAIGAALDTGELQTVQTRLNQFRAALMDHLLKENVRLYVYLEHFLETDAVSHELMRGFRHEMDGIGRVVVEFLGKYKDIGLHAELAEPFRTDLVAIGEALVSRIRREEEILYPMYLPVA